MPTRNPIALPALAGKLVTTIVAASLVSAGAVGLPGYPQQSEASDLAIGTTLLNRYEAV